MTHGAGDLLAQLALRHVAERYAQTVDQGDGEGFAALFTEDGILRSIRGEFVGRMALSAVPAFLKARYTATFHAVLNHIARIEDDAAFAETYAISRHFRMDDAGSNVCHEMTIRYQDAYVRSDVGWLLSRRELVLDASHTFAIDSPDEPRDRGSAAPRRTQAE